MCNRVAYKSMRSDNKQPHKKRIKVYLPARTSLVSCTDCHMLSGNEGTFLKDTFKTSGFAWTIFSMSFMVFTA